MLIAHSTSAIPEIDIANIHVLISKWHKDYVERIVARFEKELTKSGNHSVSKHMLSGCLEMPLACMELHRRFGREIDAYVCFGVLMKGETAHFDMILSTLTSAFAQITVNHRLPIINCIVPANTLSEVSVRSADDEFNKGAEAALAAIETVQWLRSI